MPATISSKFPQETFEAVPGIQLQSDHFLLFTVLRFLFTVSYPIFVRLNLPASVGADLDDDTGNDQDDGKDEPEGGIGQRVLYWILT